MPAQSSRTCTVVLLALASLLAGCGGRDHDRLPLPGGGVLTVEVGGDDRDEGADSDADDDDAAFDRPVFDAAEDGSGGSGGGAEGDEDEAGVGDAGGGEAAADDRLGGADITVGVAADA